MTDDDLGRAHRERLLSAIRRCDDGPSGPAVRRMIAGMVLLGLATIVLAAAVTVASEMRDDIRAVRRAEVHPCR